MNRILLISLAGIFLAGAIAYFILVAMPDLFISDLSEVKVGMTKDDVYKKVGMPQFFGPKLTDNWYFVHSGPIIVYAVDVEISRDDNPASPDGKTFYSSEYVTSVLARKVSCFSSLDAIKQASQK